MPRSVNVEVDLVRVILRSEDAVGVNHPVVPMNTSITLPVGSFTQEMVNPGAGVRLGLTNAVIRT
jgi:hypothetical protein